MGGISAYTSKIIRTYVIKIKTLYLMFSCDFATFP